eukprot:scaffold1916_cov123-Isochrysis_galbana.AAC.16
MSPQQVSPSGSSPLAHASSIILWKRIRRGVCEFVGSGCFALSHAAECALCLPYGGRGVRYRGLRRRGWVCLLGPVARGRRLWRVVCQGIVECPVAFAR